MTADVMELPRRCNCGAVMVEHVESCDAEQWGAPTWWYWDCPDCSMKMLPTQFVRRVGE